MELNKYFLNWFHKERSCLVYFLLQIYITTHVLTVFSILCTFAEYWMKSSRVLYCLHREQKNQQQARIPNAFNMPQA